jgi:AcrR family transcriptional regulator
VTSSATVSGSGTSRVARHAEAWPAKGTLLVPLSSPEGRVNTLPILYTSCTTLEPRGLQRRKPPEEDQVTMSSEVTPRQVELIEAATSLFGRRGYHAVGVSDVSGHLGLTGPAFYRHFNSKADLLVAVLDRVISGQLQRCEELLDLYQDPAQALTALVASHVRFVFEHAEYFAIWRSDLRLLPPEQRRRLSRMQREYLKHWERALLRHSPGLSSEEASTRCAAVIALMQSPTEPPRSLPEEQLEPLLEAMATQLLLGPVAGAA